MRVQTRSVNFKADQKLLDYVEKKVEKLDQFFNNIVDAEIFLKLENSGQVKDKITEIRLKVPGETLIASDTQKTFESSTDKAVDVMKRNLKRYKEKLQSR